MLVNPYDDRKVSLWRLHGNGDLDIVWASYTRRKANVTQALKLLLTTGPVNMSIDHLFANLGLPPKIP